MNRDIAEGRLSRSPHGNYVIEVGNYVIVSPSELGNYTIADSAARELPPAALIPLSEAGTPNLARVLASVVRRPRQIGTLIGLALETRLALLALAGPARALRSLAAAV